MNLFEVKAKYQKNDEQGNKKNVTESYIVDAVSFTESEARIHEVLKQYISGEFKIVGMKPSNLSKIINDEDGQYYYKAKVSIVTLNEVSGAKISTMHVLVSADSLKQGVERIEKSFEKMIVTWLLKSIVESNIIDVFPYFEKEKDGKGGN